VDRCRGFVKKKRRRALLRRLCREGFTTVEAALVISFILFLMTAFMLMMFYLHDRALLYEIALKDGERIMKMVEEPVSEQGKLEMKRLKEQNFLRIRTYISYVNTESWEAAFRAEAEETLFLTEVTSVEVELSDRGASVKYSGRFRLPVGGVTRRLLEGALTMEGTVTCKKDISPEELVRISRSIKGK